MAWEKASVGPWSRYILNIGFGLAPETCACPPGGPAHRAGTSGARGIARMKARRSRAEAPREPPGRRARRLARALPAPAIAEDRPHLAPKADPPSGRAALRR